MLLFHLVGFLYYLYIIHLNFILYILSLTRLSVCPFVMALRTFSAFLFFFLPSLLQHLTISLPQHVMKVFSTFFIISCTNVLRCLLSMPNDVCYRLFPRLSRIICSFRLNLCVFDNKEPFKRLLGFLRSEDRDITKP